MQSKEAFKFCSILRTKPKKPKSCIYFVLCNVSNRVKIGITKGLKNRLQCLRGSSPTELELLCVIKNQTKEQEELLHKQFEKHRHHGEWYRYHPEIQKYILDLETNETLGKEYKVN